MCSRAPGGDPRAGLGWVRGHSALPVLPRVSQLPSQNILGSRLAGAVPPTLQVALTIVTPKQPKGANAGKVKGSEVKIKPDSEVSVKDTNPAQLGRCQGRKCSSGAQSPLGASSSLGMHCCVSLIKFSDFFLHEVIFAHTFTGAGEGSG